MKILYLSQYFPPEIGATQTRAYEMALNLVNSGHYVTVMTEIPNHPLGIVFDGYKKKFFMREYVDGIEVIRSWVYTNPVKNFSTRTLFYASYMVSSVINSMFLRKDYDLLFATSPPLFVGLAGLIISRIKKIPFVFEVRDLWPESAVTLGELRNPYAISLSQAIARMLYRNSVKIVAVTKGIYSYLGASLKIPKEKLVLIPNGANVDLYKPAERHRELLRKVNIKDSDFVVLYAGLHGLIHGLESVIDAAYILKDKGVSFLFIGDGVKKAEIMKRASLYSLTNVVFLSSISEKSLPLYVQSCDVGIATTIKNDFCKGTIPVKMFSYMACAKPVLLCADGEARDIINESKAGICVEPENPKAIADAILFLKENPALCKEMGSRGRKYVEKYYSRKELAKRLEKVFLEVVKT